MKLTTRILISLFILMLGGLFASNMLLKKQYNALDKTDIFWTYQKILEKPFKHVSITGGNETNIYYEYNRNCSVRLLQEWVTYQNGEVKASVKNDTLFLDFDYKPKELYQRFWLQTAAPVRIFAPEILSVTGHNTNFEMHDARQKQITVNISGKSNFEMESLYRDMDSVNVIQSDSSAVKFEISPDLFNRPAEEQQHIKLVVRVDNGAMPSNNDSGVTGFNESMSIRAVTAAISGHSLLDIGHAQIGKTSLQISDSAAIILSGKALRSMNQLP